MFGTPKSRDDIITKNDWTDIGEKEATRRAHEIKEWVRNNISCIDIIECTNIYIYGDIVVIPWGYIDAGFHHNTLNTADHVVKR